MGVALATLLPLWYLLDRARERGLDAAIEQWTRPRTLELLVNTGLLTAGVAVVSLLIGVGSAVLVNRVDLPWPRAWWVVLALPVAVPSYVVAFTIRVLSPSASGLVPSVLAIALTTVPLVALPTLAALARADHGLAEVARSLGRSPARAFLTTTLPQVLPAAAAGTVLAVLYALSDFATPAMLRYQTLTVGIYRRFSGTIDRTSVATLALVLVVLALVVVLLEQLLRRIARSGPATLGGRRVPPSTGSALRRWSCALLVALPVLAAVGVPVLTLLNRLAEGSRYTSTLQELLPAAWTTLVLGLVTAGVATVLALPVAALSARSNARWVRATEAASFLGQALPGVAVGLSMVYLSLALLPTAGYQTTGVLIACYVILFIPKAIGSARAAVQLVPIGLEECSRTLGRGPVRAWWSVTARGALPGIGAGALLVMAATMKEVPATLMLRPIGVDTLATELWSKTSIGAYGAAAAPALFLIVVGLVPAIALSQAGRR